MWTSLSDRRSAVAEARVRGLESCGHIVVRPTGAILGDVHPPADDGINAQFGHGSSVALSLRERNHLAERL
jgi:hypothetical protein